MAEAKRATRSQISTIIDKQWDVAPGCAIEAKACTRRGGGETRKPAACPEVDGFEMAYEIAIECNAVFIAIHV